MACVWLHNFMIEHDGQGLMFDDVDFDLEETNEDEPEIRADPLAPLGMMYLRQQDTREVENLLALLNRISTYPKLY